MKFKRNLKSLNNKTGQKIKAKLNEMLNNHERYKKCYFWTNTGNAASRRSQEFETSTSFILDGKKYEWNQDLNISCKNFYWTSIIHINSKKSNIIAIKKLLA